jgi:hypothetical protein
MGAASNRCAIPYLPSLSRYRGEPEKKSRADVYE